MKSESISCEPVTVALVGCGYWGPNLARNFQSLRDCRLVGLCDRSAERLDHISKMHPGVLATPDFSELIERANPDAVVIATPVASHHKLARASLLAGKHTLVEKPLAASVHECDELVGLAGEMGVVMMTGHTFLYSAVVRKVIEIVKSGEIGEVRHIHARRLNFGLFQKDINVTWDLAPHDISIILSILGEYPLSVNCVGRSNVNRGVEDTSITSLAFSGNRLATIQNSWLEPRKVREMTIVGTEGMIVYDDLLGRDAVKVYDIRVDCPPYYDTFGEFQFAYHYGDCRIPHIRHEEPLKVECQHFLECIRKSEQPISSGIDGMKVVQILEAASLSLQNHGAPVPLHSPGISAAGSKFVPVVAPDRGAPANGKQVSSALSESLV